MKKEYKVIMDDAYYVYASSPEEAIAEARQNLGGYLFAEETGLTKDDEDDDEEVEEKGGLIPPRLY